VAAARCGWERRRWTRDVGAALVLRDGQLDELWDGQLDELWDGHHHVDEALCR